jgi:tRNA threonylcarbamoyl adenosine modification protein YeaZ
MLVLAIDTATPAVTAGIVELSRTVVAPLATRVTVDSRAHAEVLTPQILECLAEIGRRPGDLGAVVVGCGPGPFTGLRVGMATAAAFGDAIEVPVYGVCSLDAIAHEVAGATESHLTDRADDELLVVTDARRREVYWARYVGGRRIDGPGVCKPSDLEVGAARVIAGSASHVDFFDLPVQPVETPSPVGLVYCAKDAIASGVEPEALVPLYLRRPDAVERAVVAR